MAVSKLLFSFNSKCFLNSSRNVSSTFKTSGQLNSEYDAVVIGAGHNGLVAAAYLGKAGFRVCVLERRHVIGGAAVTEEIIPGFKFSRASYVLSLLRPTIIRDLELKKHGLKVYHRNPSSYTPLLESSIKNGGPRSLTLYREMEKTTKEIAKFSKKDSEAYPLYEEFLEKLLSAVDPLIDNPPPNLSALNSTSLAQKFNAYRSLKPILQSKKALGKDLMSFYDMVTASAVKILDQWFESEPLRATLATDGVIGAMQGPRTPGSGYVLLHHVMGELDGIKGAWGYPEGGMGAVTKALGNAAVSYGAHIVTSTPVKEIVVKNEKTSGVLLENGNFIRSKCVLSNATAKITFLDLLPDGSLPGQYVKEIKCIDYNSPVTKINLALKSIPNFLADPNIKENSPMPHHQATIHLNCENTELIEKAYIQGQQGILPDKPMLEMVIPSSLDPTLAPPGCYVCLMFTQYTPYNLSGGKTWDEATKKDYLNIVLNNIEAYAPGFRDSVIDGEVLSPIDLERIFNLTGGNIFHGSMSLDHMFFSRPTSSVTSPHTPLKGLYLCGSGAHPGGGVMGAAGRIAALAATRSLK